MCIRDRNKKAPTDLCKQMGKAYELNMNEQVQNYWNQIIDNDEFLTRMPVSYTHLDVYKRQV